MNSINKVIANLFFRKRVCPQILFSFASKNQGENESAFFQKNKLRIQFK